LALGAERSLVARMIVSEAARMAILGVVPGVLGAYAAARAMSALLFGVRPDDPLTISAAAGLCLSRRCWVLCLQPSARRASIRCPR
jgi:putative ABC transport system permease protein